MILAKETIERKIKAGEALLFSAKACGDEEVGFTLQSFQNLLDILGDYLLVREQLALAQKGVEWIPVGERLPEIGEHVLVQWGKHPPECPNGIELVVWDNDWPNENSITHWWPIILPKGA